MSVSNGQIANQTTFNNAFLSRTTDSDTIAVVGLNNTSNPDSGVQIVNTQRKINEVADSDGTNGEGDSTRKVYSSNNIVANGDNRKVAIGKLDAEFDSVTGHSHDNTPGSGGPISADDLSDFNRFYAVKQTFSISPALGLDDDVSATFSGFTPGGSAVAAGVVTTAPYNMCELRDLSTGTNIEDAGGQRVYARLTESAGVWTLTYYTNEAGVETAYSMPSTNLRVYFNQVFDQADRPTFNEDGGLIESLDMTSDIVPATQTVAGKVTTVAQDFGGKKDFKDGVILESSIEIPRTDVAGSASITALTYSPFVNITGATATTIRGAASGSDGKTFILHNSTTSPLSVTNEDVGATASNRFHLPAGADISLGIDESIEFIYETSISRWVIKSGSGSGSGGGSGINFLKLNSAWQATQSNNESAETSVGDWLAYADAAGTQPVDMNGGSPTVAISRTTTVGEVLDGTASFKVVKDAANRQGEGAAVVGYIPLGYQGKMVSYKIPFKIISGSIVSGDLKLFIYDVTNGQVLTPIGNDVVGASVTLSGYVQLPYGCEQIRFGFHFASTSATAVTFAFDDVVLGPMDLVIGANMTDWVEDDSVIPDATAFGTVTNLKVFSKIVGDSKFYRGYFTSGTVTANPPFLKINNASMDTSKLSAEGYKDLFGTAYGIYGATVSLGDSNVLLAVTWDGTNVDQVHFVWRETNQSNNGFLLSSDTAASLISSGAAITFEFSIPILGLSTNVTNINNQMFRLSDYLSTQVTAPPAQLGEYRSMIRSGANVTTGSDSTPTNPPSLADGIKIYSDAYNTAGTAGQIQRYEFFVGFNKHIEWQFYANAGRTGYLSVDTRHSGGATVERVKGADKGYDPQTGIAFIDTLWTNDGSDTIHELGNTFSGTGAVTSVSVGYLDLFVSEQVVPVQFSSDFTRDTIHGFNLVDNTASATTIASIPVTSLAGLKIVYGIQRDTDSRHSDFWVSFNGASTAYSDGPGVELGTTGITLTATISGGFILFQYTSSSTGFDGTMNMEITKIPA